MKRVLLAVLFLFLFGIGYLLSPKTAAAQGDIFCSVSFGDCTATGINCDPGYDPPCGVAADCCLEYYNTYGDCPFTLDCGSCAWSQIGPLDVGEGVTEGFIFAEPNTTYALGIAPPTCTIPATVTTDSTGRGLVTINCSVPGTYVISTGSGTNSCSTSFEVVGACSDTCYILFCPPGWESAPGDCGFGSACCRPAPVPSPTGPPLESCDPGDVCIGLDPGPCGARGGYVRDCLPPLGISDCCVAPTPMPTPTPPPDKCPANYYCEFVGGFGNACEENLGDPRPCSGPEEPDGNCCLPSAGTYCCLWAGAECQDEISSSGGCPYDCKIANFGPCPEDDPTCTACSEYTTPEACTDGNYIGFEPAWSDRKLCVEQNPTTGYYCPSAIEGCQPCFDWSTNPGCNPPEYSDPGTCDLACSGIIPIKWACDAGTGDCNESGDGPYEDYTSCILACGDGEPPPELCDVEGEDEGSINTAIGCIPVSDTNEFIKFILRWALGIAGGIAFILILVAGFQIITSSGDPKRLQAGKELLTSAIAGLLLLIFSAFILRLIGVDILGLPGFGG